MRTWLLIIVLAIGTVLMKTIGPVLAGGRQPPAALMRVIALVAPALISALIVAAPSLRATGHRCRRGAASRSDLVVVSGPRRTRDVGCSDRVRTDTPCSLTGARTIAHVLLAPDLVASLR
jgi:hypothetical protein